jgi:hypothetical protein
MIEATMKIFCDIDGVIRRLSHAALGFEPHEWYFEQDGMNVFDIVNKNPSLCEIASPYEDYLEVINSLDSITFLSNQLPAWQPFTSRWLNRHVTTTYKAHYTNNDKFAYLNDGDWLIEDFPYFPDYSRVILVDRPYNRATDAPLRVSSAEELADHLSTISLVEGIMEGFEDFVEGRLK